MSGWKQSNRKARLPSDWRRITLAVRRRDRGVCTLCGQPGTDVDHIEPGDNHAMSNLRLLCSPCHARKSAREGAAAMAVRRAKTTNRFRFGEDVQR